MSFITEVSRLLVKYRKSFFLGQLFLFVALFLALGLPEYNGNLDGLESEENPEFQKLVQVDSLFRNGKVFYFLLTPESKERKALFDCIDSLETSVASVYPDVKFITPVPFYRKMIRYFGADSENTDVFIKKADSIPLLKELISHDKSSLMCIMSMHEEYDVDIEKIDSIVSNLESDKVSIGTLSEPHLNNAIQNTLSRDMLFITTGIFIIFIAYILYMVRSISAVIYMATLIVLCLGSGVLIFSVLGFEINVISMISLPIILILVLSDSLHLLAGTNKLYSIEDNEERTEKIFSHYMIPSFYSSVTTAVAFLSFYFFGESDFVRQFGLVTAIGLMIEFLITYAASPFLLNKIRTKSLHDLQLIKFNRFLFGNKRSLTTLMGIAAVASLFVIPSLEIDSSPDSYFPKNDELTDRYEYFKDNYFAPLTVNVLVRNKGVINDSTKALTQGEAKRLTKEIREIEHVSTVISSADEFYFKTKLGLRVNLFNHLGNLNPYYNSEKDIYLIEVRIDELNNTEGVVRQLNSIVVPNGIELTTASEEVMLNQMNREITLSLLKSLLTSGLGIFLIFLLLIKSLRLALLSLLPNVVPIGITLLVFYFADFKLDLLTSLTLVISLGLLDDDTVHIIYRRFILKEPMGEMNFSVMSSALLLIVSFLLFTLSKFEPVQIFGIVCSVIFLVGIFSELVIFKWIIETVSERKINDK